MFFCKNCGYKSIKWLGRCPECGEWDCFQKEETLAERKKAKTTPAQVFKITDLSVSSKQRISSGIAEFDRVLGGGIVKAEAVLIAGSPGIGKSTLLLEVAGKLSAKAKVLYISAEESLSQVKMRADRLGIESNNLYLASENDLEKILDFFEDGYSLIIIDSIQVLSLSKSGLSRGSILQIRECANALVEAAKTKSVPVLIVGHVTKEGDISGPKVLEHIVDAVIYFEGEKNSHYRILRAVKNRFGSTGEIGVFEMQASGLAEVENPSSVFISHKDNYSGRALACVVEGSRAIVVEIQSLVAKANFNMPRRKSSGFDFNRFSLISAMAEKRLGLGLALQDIFVNVVGGIRVDDPAADLALAISIVSGYKDIIIPSGTVFLGELGLLGELRVVPQIEVRLKECQRLGVKQVFVPAVNLEKLDIGLFKPVKITGAENIKGVLNKIDSVKNSRVF